METLQTNSTLLITQPLNPLLKTSAFILLMAVNPVPVQAQATAMAIPSSQLYEWERQLPASQSPVSNESDYRAPLDLFMKPAPVRRYKVKGRVRSVRQGVIG